MELELEKIADTLEKAYIVEQDGNILNITLPYFFADENGKLKLTIKRHEDFYYVHDNGCTNARLGVENKPLCYVMYQNDLMVFYDYILRHVNGFELEDGEHFADESKVLSAPATQDPSEILNNLRPRIRYGENKGIFVYPHLYFYEHATGLSIFLSVNKDGVLTVSDGNAGKLEGEVVGCGFGNDWYEEMRETAEKVCKIYGAEMRNQALYVTTPDKNDYVRAIAKYMRAAIIIAHYGFGE